MTEIVNWLLDFDETLATSPLTWALEFSFPRLIADHALPCDTARLESAVLAAQERSNREYDPRPILVELFQTMAWPLDLTGALLQDVLTNYQPALFDDAVPFLRRLREQGRQVVVVSNNPLSVGLLATLGIEDYVSAIYTPRQHPGTPAKPHRGLWDLVAARHPEMTLDNSAVVGDDPWSDGLFADACGLPCWLVDRRGRFDTLRGDYRYRWARSLLDIPLDTSL